MPPGTKDKKKKDLSLEDIFGNGSAQSAVAEPARKSSNGGTSLEDIFGNGEQATIEKKSQVQSSDDTGIPSQDGIVDISQSNSASSFGIEPLKNQTENPLVPKAFQQEIPTLTPTQKAAAASLQQTKDTENDIKSWMTNPDAGTIDTNKPTTSKYNNAKAEALKALTETSNDLAIAGGKPIDVQAAINNPDQFPDVVSKIKNYYDKKIAATIDYTYDRFGEKRAGTERDNAASLALKSEKDKALKNIGLLRDIAIVKRNPDATPENIGSEILKSDDPIAYSNLQVAPNMTSVNYRKKKMGLEAKLAAAALDIESGTATPETVAKANKIVQDGQNLVYEYPDIRKGQLRQMVMEQLATKDKLGGFVNDEAAKKALGEIDELIANPVNPKDVPLLKQMKEDLDFGLGKNIMSDAFVNVPNAEAKYNKYLKEREQYKGQSALENFGSGLGGTFTETAKWIAGKTGLRDDKERLTEADNEQIGTKNYDPKKYTFQVPKYTIDINKESPTRGQMVANPDAGDFQLRTVPYKAMNGLGQLTGQLALGELVGAGVAGTVGRAIELGGEGVSGVVGSANSIMNASTAAAKAIEMEFKVMAPAYAMSYDQNRKEGLKMFGSDEAAAWKVDAYSNAASMLEGLTEKIGNPYEQMGMIKSVFKAEVKDELARNIAGLSIRQIENLSKPAMEKFLTGAVKAVGKGLKNVTGEASEEWLNAYGQYGTAAVLGADVSQRSGIDEANHAFMDAMASMSFLGAAGTFTGARDYYSNSGMSQQAMFDIGSNADTYRDAINNQFANGILNEKERDTKLNLVNSAEVAKADWNDVKQYAKPSADVTQAAKKGVNYVQARANELALQKEHDNSTNPVRQQKLAGQIKKWQNVQQALIDMPVDFNTDAVPVLPAVTSNGLVEVRAPNMDEVPVELQAQAVETISPTGVPEVVFYVPNQDAPKPIAKTEEKIEEPAVKLNEIFDVPVIYKGQRGVVSREGQVAVFKPEGQERLIELGTIDDTENTVGIGNQSISDFDIEQEKSVVLSNDKGNIVVRGKEYVNNYSDPEAAITRDADGNIQSVSLETVGGAKRNFRGREAEDIAYQIKLKVQDRQNKAKQLAQLAAERDKANNEIQTAYQDNVQEPDAWVKPYEAAREAQDEAVKSLVTEPSAETQTTTETAQPQNEELARKLGSIRNDDFMRQYFNEEDNAAYEKADEEGKANLIKAKKEILLNGGTTTEINQPLQQNESGTGQQNNQGPISENVAPIERPNAETAATLLVDNTVGKEGRNISDFSNENESYRVIVGDDAFNDIVESGVVRTNANTKGKKEGGIDLTNRPTAFPSFSKGKASVEYANENPNNYIIVTEDASIQPSKAGRHGKGTTMFPTDESGNHLKELSGEKVKVYKHTGEGQYELVYENGKLVEPSKTPSKADNTVVGEPKEIELYHGGPEGVVDFKDNGAGIYLTPHEDIAKEYADIIQKQMVRDNKEDVAMPEIPMDVITGKKSLNDFLEESGYSGKVRAEIEKAKKQYAKVYKIITNPKKIFVQDLKGFGELKAFVKAEVDNGFPNIEKYKKLYEEYLKTNEGQNTDINFFLKGNKLEDIIKTHLKGFSSKGTQLENFGYKESNEIFPVLKDFLDKNGYDAVERLYDVNAEEVNKVYNYTIGNKEWADLKKEFIFFDKNALKTEPTRTPIENETQATKAEDIKPTEKEVIADKEADTDSGSTEPPKETAVESAAESNEGVRITHAATEAEREAMNLPEREKHTEKENAILLEEADKVIKEGYNVATLINKILNTKHVRTDLEAAILSRYIATLKVEISNGATNEQIEQYSKALTAAEKGGSEAGAALQAQKLVSPIDDSLADFFIRDLAANMGAPLTDLQKAATEKEYADITAAKKAYEDKITALEAENAKLKAQKEFDKNKPKSKPADKKTHEDYTKERNKIVDSLKEKLSKANQQTYATLPLVPQLIAIAPDVAKLVKSYVEEGVTALADVVSNIHGVLKDNIEGITEKDVHDIIAGEYNRKQKTRGEATKAIIDLREQAKLQNKLDALLAGQEPKVEKQKIKRNQEIEKLRQDISDFKKQKADSERAAIEAKEKAEKDIAKAKKDAENATTKAAKDAAIATERKAKEDLKEANKKTPEQSALQSLKTRTANEIRELEAELNSGNLLVDKPKREPIKLDKEATDLKDKLIKLKQEREIRILKQQYAMRNGWQKAGDLALEVLNVPRTVMASMDFSAPLRQGLVPSISHPTVAAKAFVEMFQQAVSQKRFDRWFFDLRESPEYKVMEKANLYVADPHNPKLTAKEEAFMNNLAEKIPLIGRMIKGSERAYISYLNKMRVDLFQKGVDAFEAEGKTIDNSPELYKGLASWVNNSTGRGSLGKIEAAAPVFNSVFFSPRLIASRFNLLNPVYYAKLPKEVRVQALIDMAKFIGLGTSILALVSLAGGDDKDDATVEFDPRSTDFAKIKIGDKRYDIWGGFQPFVRVAAQMFGKAKSIKTGKLTSLTGEGAFSRDRGDVLSGFFRGKLAPVPASALNLIIGRNIIGEDATISTELQRNLLPLIFSDVKEAMKDEGAAAILTTLLPATFGVGVQNFDTDEVTSKKKVNVRYNGDK